MSLQAALTILLEEIPRGKNKDFEKNEVAEFIRKDARAIIVDIVNDQRYLVKGSAGQGVWAGVPWVAVMDRFITDTAEQGYYVVYLVCEDCSGLFISLNQGVTRVKKIHGRRAKKALQRRAAEYLERIGPLPAGWKKGKIDLRLSGKSSLAANYEVGNICAKFYDIASLKELTEEVLIEDLQAVIDIYGMIGKNEQLVSESSTMEEDEASLGWEDLTALREHKRYDRDASLAKLVKKKQGYTCQACGFNFHEAYGEIGQDYIEAHHLVPFSELKGKRVPMNPKTDFAVLCSNCHRMIHKTDLVSDVAEFARKHLTGRQGKLGI